MLVKTKLQNEWMIFFQYIYFPPPIKKIQIGGGTNVVSWYGMTL